MAAEVLQADGAGPLPEQPLQVPHRPPPLRQRAGHEGEVAEVLDDARRRPLQLALRQASPGGRCAGGCRGGKLRRRFPQPSAYPTPNW